MLYRIARALLFRMDAEEAHEFVTRHMESLQQIPIALRTIDAICGARASPPVQLMGLTFPNRIGVAAGFDKNARLIPMLAALGFGFIEVGTVTLHPQPGNPRPRLFRYPESRALINRMGFNNEGAEAIAERIRGARATTPARILVNIGKNRDVPLEAAPENYARCYEIVAPEADAVVLNLSSPNTPGLRELQRPEQIETLLQTIDRKGRILIKIAPDLDDVQLAEVTAVCVRYADGMICTNTTLDRQPGMTEAGGLSGAPLKEKSTAVLKKVRRLAGRDYPLIGVGGIFTRKDADEKFEAGANLIQIYTSFIYEGPRVVRALR